jgi:hypothetical protein
MPPLKLTWDASFGTKLEARGAGGVYTVIKLLNNKWGVVFQPDPESLGEFDAPAQAISRCEQRIQ